MKRVAFRVLLSLFGTIAALSCASFGQRIAHEQKANVTLTGVTLVSDCRQCTNHSRRSDYALFSGPTTYLLYGDNAELQRFGDQRVKVTGVLEEEPFTADGLRLLVRKIFVRSIERDEMSEADIVELVEQLRTTPWRGVENHCVPMCWSFNFTDPMGKILQAGHTAQDVLLRHLSDSAILDQVVLLLGGVGDEEAIWPIIDAMADADQARLDPRAKRLNQVANLALTNLTVSEVIWHHGGGISRDRCPDDPKSCWSQWWLENKNGFRVGVGGDRRYSNYPNYGIYMQFEGRFDTVK